MTKKKPYLSGFPMFFDFITVKLPYARVETISSWEFDVVVTYDTASTTQTTSGWRIVGLQDVEVRGKYLNITGYKYSYSYYDNYQGLEIDITYYYVSGGLNYTGHKTVKARV